MSPIIFVFLINQSTTSTTLELLPLLHLSVLPPPPLNHLSFIPPLFFLHFFFIPPSCMCHHSSSIPPSSVSISPSSLHHPHPPQSEVVSLRGSSGGLKVRGSSSSVQSLLQSYGSSLRKPRGLGRSLSSYLNHATRLGTAPPPHRCPVLCDCVSLCVTVYVCVCVFRDRP